MKAEEIIKEAESIAGQMILERRFIHNAAEVGFELNKTRDFVMDTLSAIGCTPSHCGKCGVRCEIGEGERVVLLRADMDALPIREKTDLPFQATNGNMHACGHDMHTSMLLGAARLLKKHERELGGRVRLMFQPAEELLAGARDMIEAGILDQKPEAALMIHLTLGGMKSGSVIIPDGGATAPAVSFFKITVLGSGAHGAMPQSSRDALLAATLIYSHLTAISSRELSSAARLTVGCLNGGQAANVICAEATLEGTLRAFDNEEKKRLEGRINDIALGVALGMDIGVRVEFFAEAPALICDEKLSRAVLTFTRELFGDSVISTKDLPPSQSVGGSEDFAFISENAPSVMIAISAGESGALHAPTAIFDESVLSRGSAILAYNAYKLLS